VFSSGRTGQLIYIGKGGEGGATCSLIRSMETKVQSMWQDAGGKGQTTATATANQL